MLQKILIKTSQLAWYKNYVSDNTKKKQNVC